MELIPAINETSMETSGQCHKVHDIWSLTCAIMNQAKARRVITGNQPQKNYWTSKT